jgi:uncharacterized iron-regulated membrane protein
MASTSGLKPIETTSVVDETAGIAGVGTGTKARPRSEKRRFRVRKVSYLIHSFVGLKLTILLSIVFLTGTLAVFYQEIDWLLYQEKRVVPQTERLNPGAVLDRVREALPDYGLVGYGVNLSGSRTADSLFAAAPEGGFRSIWVDPYTGEVNGVTNFVTVGSFILRLHTTLYLPVVGRAFVNFFGVLCLISLITGIINYPKFWRYFFRKPRFHRDTRTWMGDIHRLFAIWSLWFVLIMGVSGTWWFYQNPLVHYDVAPQFLPTRAAAPAVTNEDLEALAKGIPTRLSAEEVVNRVRAHDPDLRISWIAPPEHNGLVYNVRGTHGDLLTGGGGSVIHVHPFSGEILGENPASEMTALQRIDAAMRPLHFGTWGGSGWQDLAVKTVWFVFGLMMTAMAISGAVIYYKRTGKAFRAMLPEQPGRERRLAMGWHVLKPWGGPMSGFKYFNWGTLLFVGVGSLMFVAMANQGPSVAGYQYNAQPVGDWTVKMNAIYGFLERDLDPINAGGTTNIMVSINEGDFDAIKFMYVNIGKPRTMRAPGMVIHGAKGFSHAHLPVPEELADDAELWLTIEDWDGSFYQASWPLMPDGLATIDTRIEPAVATAAAEQAEHPGSTVNQSTARVVAK